MHGISAWIKKGDYPIDTHILHYGEPQEWLDQAIASIEHEPTRILLVSGGFKDNIGAARAYAFGLCKAPTVTFIDPDDTVLPGTVPQCLDKMLNNPGLAGVYTDYQAVTADGRVLYTTAKPPWHARCLLHSGWEVLHYHLYRRDAVTPTLDTLATFPWAEEMVIAGLAQRHGDFAKLDIVGYVKREIGGSGRLSSSETYRRAIKTITPAIIASTRRGLGDRLEGALRAVGIHQAVTAVSKRLGVDCGCARRKEALNRWSAGRHCCKKRL